MNEGFTTAFERECLAHATALEKCRDENEKLKKELEELKATISAENNRETKNPVIGTFDTHEVRPWNQPRAGTSRTVYFTSPYHTSPGLPVGLNMLDMANAEMIRVKALTNNIQNDSFKVSVDAWSATTKLYSGGCTWLEVEKDDPDFQFGTFNTLDNYHWDNPQKLHTRLVTFPRAYSSPPRVVVWFTILEMTKEFDWRVKTYETNVTATGFTLHIDSWGDSVLRFATATWVAYTSNKPSISSGKFSTLDARPANAPQSYNNGYVKFDSNVFATPPRVLVALNSLEMSCKFNLRISTKVSDVSAAGMTWHINSWGNSVLYSAGASYIALD